MSAPTQSPIAIVGVSALFPGSLDATGFWKDILRGADLMSDVPPTHWLIDDYYHPDPSARDKTYARRGAFIRDVQFDPLAWGVPPSTVPATDTCQLLALIVAEQVLEDACHGDFTRVDRDRASVILGVTSAQELLNQMVSRLQRPVWVKGLRDAGFSESEVERACEQIAGNYVEWQEATFPGVLGNVVAGRIANRLDLGGTNCVTDAACASTFSALSMSVNELRLGQSDLVITGGADTMNDIFMYMCFSKTPALSKTEDCRPFSDQADGTMLGEGLGMVALRRLDDAERDGDRIYGVIRGVGSSSDGRSKSVYAPRPAGQAKALHRAYQQAGFDPDTVELIEAHGTATMAGDAAEFEALRTVFDGTGRSDRQWCALGSVKSQVGHTKAAAGAAGLFKAVMAVHHKVLPPTIKVERPNPALEIESSPFYLNTRARPWIRDDRHPRRCGVSAFGFGGSNFHVVVEEYSGPAARAARARTWPHELCLLGADTPADLAERCREFAAAATAAEDMLPFLAHSSQRAFSTAAPCRLGIIAADGRELAAKLGAAAVRVANGERVLGPGLAAGSGPRRGGLAFLFPGQGSQYLSMGDAVAMALEPARLAWDLAATVERGRPEPLHQMVFPVPAFSAEDGARQADRLMATDHAQPAIGVASLALLRVLRAAGLTPDAVAGHSFGEVTAAHAAGMIGEADLIRTARRRGELMATAAAGTSGAMTAVTASPAQVEPHLDPDAGVAIANHNGPRQLVLSGPVQAIVAVEGRLGQAGLQCRRLDVATAFHSPVVAPAAEAFGAFLSDVGFSAPSIEIWSGADAAPYPTDGTEARRMLGEQLRHPVRFAEVVEGLYRRDIRTFVEVGPGAVLTGLTASILGDRDHTAIALDRQGKNGLHALMSAFAELAAAGVEVDYDVLWEGYAEPGDPRERPTPKMTMAINGSNYGKLYPPAERAETAVHPLAAQAPHEAAAAPPPADRLERSVATAARPASPAPLPADPGQRPADPAHLAPTPIPPPPTPSSVPATLAGSALAAVLELERRTADAHETWQRTMAETHTAYLRTVETTMAALAAATGATIPVGDRHSDDSPPLTLAPVALPLPPASAPLAAGDAPPLPVPVATPVVSPSPVAAPIPLAEPAPRDLDAMLLAIVADKTGYPTELLAPDMDLEADLGIDSIKRVEILAAMREQAPELPEVDGARLATLRTLSDVASHMRAAGAAGAAPAPVAAVGVERDLAAMLLAIVADKTGYPTELLAPDMDLEADLGIDSIKRVEILAAMREQAPELPEVDGAQLATLRTLTDVVRHMGAGTAPTVATVAGDPVPPSASFVASGAVAEPGAPPDGAPGRYVLRLTPTLVADMAPAALTPGRRVAITDDRAGVAAALAAALTARGLVAEVVQAVTDDDDAVVFLGGLRDLSDDLAATAVNRDAFLVARAVAPRLSRDGGLFVTVQDTGGDFGRRGSERAVTGGLTGLVKTAAREWPRACVRALDIERGNRAPEVVAQALADELLTGADQVEVGLMADGRRLTLVATETPVPDGAPALDQHDVLVFTGGARGVTAACVRALADQCGARFALFGRSPLVDEPEVFRDIDDDAGLKRALLAHAEASGERISPRELSARAAAIVNGREIRSTLAAVRDAGGEARYLSVDVRDAAAVNDAVAAVRAEWGPITGLVHAAGVVADRSILDKTVEQFDDVFATKVEGWTALAAATRDDPVRVLVAFTSIAGRMGNAGQSDYAMANEALTTLLLREKARRDPGTCVKALAWGPWRGGMVDRGLAARFEASGVPLISLDVGGRMFVDELVAGDPDVEVVIGPSPHPGARLGAPALDGNDDQPMFSVRINREKQPFLNDHRVDGLPVVPLAMVIEWVTRAARARRPDLTPVGIADVSVLRGLRLESFENGGDQLLVRVHGGGEDVRHAALMTEVVGDDGLPRYRARVELAGDRSTPAGPVTVPAGLTPWSGDIYEDALFHGPDFRMIRSVDGVSDSALTARLVGVRGQGWRDDHWVSDPVLVDGALQMAVLWTRHVLGRVSLPTGIGQYRWFTAEPHPGVLRGVLTGRRNGDLQGHADVVFIDDDGNRIAELRDIQTTVLANHGASWTADSDQPDTIASGSGRRPA